MNNIESRMHIKCEGRSVEVSCVNGSGSLAKLPNEDFQNLVRNTIVCPTLKVGTLVNTTEGQFARVAEGRENQLVDELGLRRVIKRSEGLLEVYLVELVRGSEHFQAVTDGSRVIFAGAHEKPAS